MAIAVSNHDHWDRRLWRLSLCFVWILAAACTTTPRAEPEPEPLSDRTAETDYRLEKVAGKLRDAEYQEGKGRRGIAILVIESAQQLLPQGHERERMYLEVVKATIWGREGEGRDEARARDLLTTASIDALTRRDWRLKADVELANVVLRLAANDRSGAQAAAQASLRMFAAAGAHARAVEAARQLAFQFLEAEDVQTAQALSARAHNDAQRIDDDRLLIQTCLDVGRIELIGGADPEPDPYFLQAYEASYRLNDLGWRNLVIAVALDAWYVHGDLQACVRWGDRLRAYDGAALPLLEESGLYEQDYILLMLQYRSAASGADLGHARATEAWERAKAAIETLPEAQQKEWRELAENLRPGDLHPGEEK